MDAIESPLGAETEALLGHRCVGVSAAQLHLPGPDIIDRVWVYSDRKPAVLRNLQALFGTGRLAGTGCRPERFLPACI